MNRSVFLKGITIHPLLLAVHPVLFLYQNNINKVEFKFIVLPMAITLLGAVSAWALLSVATRSGIKAGLTISLFLVLFFSYGHVFNLTRDKQVFHLMVNHRLLLPIWCCLFLAGTGLIWNSSSDLRLINRSVNYLSGFLVILCVASIIAYVYRQSVTGSNSVAPVSAAMVPSTKAANASTSPDVYFIVLDSYAGSSALDRLYGDSNEYFIKALKSKHFYVAEHSYSNYDNTLPSIAATLNMGYINNVYSGNLSEEQQYAQLRTMIDNSIVARFFETRGYRVHFLNAPTKPKQLDFNEMLLETTALAYWQTREAYRRHVLSAFEQFRRLINAPGPKFVYAHFDVPHSPFVFGADCQAINADLADKKLDGSEKPNRHYMNQLLCVNKKVETILDEILATSVTQPIIILEGDHGPPIGVAGVPPVRSKDRFSILSAYYLPDSAVKHLYNTISPVNTFRFILGQCFGADFALIPDEHYAILWSKTGKLTNVTDDMK